MIQRHNKEDGFTLLEVAIVIIIGGVLLSLLSSALLVYVKKNRIATTEQRMNGIQEAIAQYLNVNRKYPCPAPLTAGPDDTTFGREVTLDCNTGAFAGTVQNSGVRIGAVPTRSLNLPDEYAMDSWGNKYVYAVTEVLATANLYAADGGVIRVIDSAGNELVSPPSNPSSRAHYVVLSHGESAAGAYPIGAVASPPTPCPGSGMEAENCNDDITFRSTLFNSDANSASFYDDYIVYQGQTTPVLSIPAGAIIPFASSSCPPGGGWAPYAEAEGRFVLGFDPTPETLDKYILSPDTTSSTTLGPNVQDTSGGDDEAVIPPFVALLYCRKL